MRARGVRGLVSLVDVSRSDRIGLAAQDWLVTAPGKIVVTFAGVERARKKGGEVDE